MHTGECSSADGWELVMLKELPIEPEPQAMLQLEAGSGGNNLLSSFSVCLPSLHFSHQIIVSSPGHSE